MIEFKFHPTPEFRFFLYDPEGDGMRFYRSVEDRDADAQEAIAGYLDDGWSEEVKNVVAGEITHHTVPRNVQRRPQREDFATEAEHEEALSEGNFSWNDFDYTCDYSLAPIADPGEKLP